MMISPEQFGFAERQVSIAAQLTFAWWLHLHPGATKADVIKMAGAVVSRFGPVAARFACAYYMAERDDDGWRILPAGGWLPATLANVLEREYDDAAPNRGLRGVIDRAVKTYGRRTMARGRGSYESGA